MAAKTTADASADDFDRMAWECPACDEVQEAELHQHGGEKSWGWICLDCNHWHTVASDEAVA